jgi:hypothetical protein
MTEHLAINLDKKEYLDPFVTDDLATLGHILEEETNLMAILAVLLSKEDPKFQVARAIQGRWAGDRIAFVGRSHIAADELCKSFTHCKEGVFKNISTETLMAMGLRPPSADSPEPP